MSTDLIKKDEGIRVLALTPELIEEAEALEITDTASAERADAIMVDMATIIKIRKAYHADEVDAAYKLHKALKGKQNKSIEVPEAILSGLKLKRGDYNRKVREAAQRAIQEAEDKARMAAAEAAEKAGDNEQAEAIISGAAPVVMDAPVPIEQTIPKGTGVSGREKYVGVITNPDMLPRKYLMPNQKLIDEDVARLGAQANIPGVTIMRDETIAVRAKV